MREFDLEPSFHLQVAYKAPRDTIGHVRRNPTRSACMSAGNVRRACHTEKGMASL